MRVREAVAAVVITFWAGGCEWVLGIEEGTVRTFCAGKPEGTQLPSDQQTPGDCVELVCDGTGQAKLVLAPLDVEDGNPCTADTCNDTTPIHTNQTHVPCYTGPARTIDVGTCKGGIQQCDTNGNLMGECIGEVLPSVLDSIVHKNNLDDDCDGAVDDDPDCGDGIFQPELGEECDDGNTDDGDPCSPMCKEQRVLAISAGGYHTCVILSGGIVKCWGRNDFGQLGLGDTNDRGDQPGEMGHKLPAVDLGSGRHALSLTSGKKHTCALLDDGNVKCWGANTIGQLGSGDMNPRGDGSGEMGDALPIVSLGSPQKPIAVAAGSGHICAHFDDGRVKCWGGNYYGQLGLGDSSTRGEGPNEMGNDLPFVNLGSGNMALAIVTGYRHTCALLTERTVKCWGENGGGQLGLGDTQNRGDNLVEMGDDLPLVWLGMDQMATAISSTHKHACVLLSTGAAKCWGWNEFGQLGVGDTNDRGDGLDEMGANLPAVKLFSDEW